MYIKGIKNLINIYGKNREIRQGFIEWVSKEEFWFLDGMTSPNRMWGKTDYWTVKEGIDFGSIIVK